MKKSPSKRQIKYAYGLMNSDKTKYQIAIDAGFSESTARVPKLIENKKSFNLAMAYVAGEMANITMKMMYEIKSRDMSEIPFKELLGAVETLSKVHERFASMSAK